MGYDHFRYARRIDGDIVELVHNDMSKLARFDKATANYIIQSGGLAVSGDAYRVKANITDTYPFLDLIGNGAINIRTGASAKVDFIHGATTQATIQNQALFLLETTTPSAKANMGALYTKNDNKVYFQDGAGVEHEVAFVP